MVEHGNVKQLAGFHQHFRDAYILGTWRRVTGGVIMYDYDRCAVGANGLAEHLADAYDGRVEAASINGGNAQHVIFRMERTEPMRMYPLM